MRIRSIVFGICLLVSGGFDSKANDVEARKELVVNEFYKAASAYENYLKDYRLPLIDINREIIQLLQVNAHYKSWFVVRLTLEEIVRAGVALTCNNCIKNFALFIDEVDLYAMSPEEFPDSSSLSVEEQLERIEKNITMIVDELSSCDDGSISEDTEMVAFFSAAFTTLKSLTYEDSSYAERVEIIIKSTLNELLPKDYELSVINELEKNLTDYYSLRCDTPLWDKYIKASNNIASFLFAHPEYEEGELQHDMVVITSNLSGIVVI